MTMVRRLALCRLVLLRCGLLRRPAAVSPALLLLLRSGLTVRLCGASGQCGLDLFADACGSLIAERIRAARRVSVYARLVLLEAGVRVVSAASAARIISVVSVVSALAGARRGCLRLLLGLLLGGVSWLRAARSYAPVYQSSAVFSVSAGFSSSTDILSHSTYLDSNAAAQLSATFPYVLQSDRMQLLLQQELGDQRAPVSLSASSVADAALFTLTATGSDPQAVYDTLLAAIEVYPAAATTILGDTQIQVIDQPVEPSAAPINANTALQTGIRRGVVGLVLGLVLVALLSLTRRTVHSAEDLHRLISLSCLSSIPAVRRGKRTRREAPSLLLTHAGTGSDFSEAMRNLSLKLQRITSKHGAKVVLITSTVPGEGKTTVASNLALALAAEGKRVILIDGDLRKQSLKPLFGIGAHSDGLVEVLSGKAKNFRLLPVPDSGLLLLSGDGTVAQPQRLLGSPRMGQILELLRQKLDYILIDTPPAGVLSDAAALAKYADGAIYVVRQDMANSVQIVNSVQSLSGAVPLYGCVLNCTQAGTTRSGYRYGYRYGYQYGYSSHYSHYSHYSSDAGDRR